jgi:hypothetical protein
LVCMFWGTGNYTWMKECLPVELGHCTYMLAIEQKTMHSKQRRSAMLQIWKVATWQAVGWAISAM